MAPPEDLSLKMARLNKKNSGRMKGKAIKLLKMVARKEQKWLMEVVVELLKHIVVKKNVRSKKVVETRNKRIGW